MVEEAVAATWTRSVEWRQGHVLTADATAALGLADKVTACVMVISHDCDLANDDLEAEPFVEVIVGRRVPEADPNLTRTKSPRTLHLEISCDGAAAAVELTATAKVLIAKSRLAAWHPDSRYRLDSNGLDTLRHWLAVRYKRAAFPDEFDRRMHKVTDLAQKLDKAVRAVDPIVSAVYFRLNPMEERPADDPTPYELTIVLTYEPGTDPERNDDLACEAAEKIRQSFSKRCFDEKTQSWKLIKLMDVVAISEDDITVSRAKQLQQWRLEHLSLKPDANSATPLDLLA